MLKRGRMIVKARGLQHREPWNKKLMTIEEMVLMMLMTSKLIIGLFLLISIDYIHLITYLILKNTLK